ncbi:MAG: sigma-54-dependent Fis family transcriptional regulator [bacterium]|nr:sigma-54-dependent Fis family transcriptional regulator [bacterium]
MTVQVESNSCRILIIDDEMAIRRTLSLVLKKAGYEIREAENLSEATRMLDQERPDLAMCDLRIGEDCGIDLIRLIEQRYPDTESILMTAFGSIESTVEAMQAGAFDYITKPFSNNELLLRVKKALERKEMKQEIITLRQHVAMSYGFDNIVGISKAIDHVKETAKRVSPTDITVLITGASGTGKELFARAIHHHSHRRNGPLVAIDCSAIPDSLLESELFGHLKGSFTSASQNKRGLLEEADGGTIFLDEVSNMSTAVQVKLLRFLQDSEIRPVGSSISKRVDVRIVAATNRDLATMVSQNEFREDLYYRLNVIPLNLPTLNERAEDVEMLTDYFLRRIAGEIKKDSLSITRAAVDLLLGHTWPGNVRELENTLKRGAALCADNHLDVNDIIFVAAESGRTAPKAAPSRTSLCLKGNLLDSNQKSLIVTALNDNDWNYTRTASELGIGRTTLWRKIRKYDLKRELVEK